MNNIQPLTPSQLKTSILLSVCIRAYNQVDFIRDAINSVLAQKMDFNFEIIISDDCSKDGTQDIIDDYQQKYPLIIRHVKHKSNLGGPNNLRSVIEASSAKYVCCLDGDDYFTDIYKLQKQVDFLESHTEYVACFHNTWVVDSTGRKLGLFNRPDFHSIHCAEEFITERWFIPIHSALLRREYIEFPEWYDSVMNDDYVIHLSMVKNGPYYYMPDVMAAYRKHDNEISVAYKDIILTDNQLITILEKMKLSYPEHYAYCFDKRIAEYEEEIIQETILRHPLLKWFQRKTYSRKIKSMLKNVLH